MFPFLSPQCVVSFAFFVSFCCVVCHVLCDLCLFVCLWNFISVVFSVCHPMFLACQSLTKKWQAKWQHQRREVSRSTVGWQRHTQMQHSWCAKLRRRATRALRCLPLPACNLILEHARRKYMQILPLPAFLLLLPAITCTPAVSAIYRGHRCLTSKSCCGWQSISQRNPRNTTTTQDPHLYGPSNLEPAQTTKPGYVTKAGFLPQRKKE